MAGNTDDGDVNRRRFLTLSGVAVAGGLTGTAAAAGSDAAPAAPETIVLGHEDLRTPGDGRYADRGGPPADARLVRHLRTAVAGFSEERVALSAFATNAGSEVPGYVESAAFSRSERLSPESVAEATDDWLRGPDRTDAPVEVDRSVDPNAVEWWSRGDDGSRDVLRLRATPAGPLLVTVACGDPAADLEPRAAVERYDRTMRRRAFV